MTDHAHATTMDNAVHDLIATWAKAERAGNDGAIGEVLTDDFRLVGPLGFIQIGRAHV